MEHTVLVTADGYEPFTVSAGTPAPPAMITEGSRAQTA